MSDQVELCHCGQPLHYTNTGLQVMVEQLIAQLGPTVKVTVLGRYWLVPRHYIALHYLRADKIESLGFEEITSC